MASLRVEFVTLGEGGWQEGVLKGIIPTTDDADTPATITVTTAALTGTARPKAPAGRQGTIYARLTAIGAPVHVTLNDVTVTLANGLRLATEIPTLVAIKPGNHISAILEA